MNQGLMHPLAASSFLNLLALVKAYGCDARFAPRLLYLMAVTLSRQPVMWAADAVYGRRLARQPIEPPPIFIIGHWRSGTTHLQNLLSCDPQFGRVTLLQAAMPHEYLLLPAFVKDRLGRMLPPRRLMDDVPVAADVPWEEELALTATSRLSFYHVSFFPRCMDRVFDEAVMLDGGDARRVAEWQRHYLAFLKKVQFLQPGLRLLLKNPANTARVGLLRRMFPGAQFIHIHRNPYKVFASSVHLYQKAQEAWGLHATSREAIVRHVLRIYPELMHAFFARRGELGDRELVELSFQSLQSDPLGTLQRIYRGLALPGFDAAAPRFQAYLESQRNYRKNNLPLSEPERDAVARRWGDIFEQLGYPQ